MSRFVLTALVAALACASPKAPRPAAPPAAAPAPPAPSPPALSDPSPEPTLRTPVQLARDAELAAKAAAVVDVYQNRLFGFGGVLSHDGKTARSFR